MKWPIIICNFEHEIQRRLLKSPTSYKRWSKHVFISVDNSHITSWFCEIALGSTTISKIDKSIIDIMRPTRINPSWSGDIGLGCV